MISANDYGNLGKVQPFARKVRHKQFYLEKTRNQNKTSLPASKIQSHELESNIEHMEGIMDQKDASRKFQFRQMCQQATYNSFHVNY